MKLLNITKFFFASNRLVVTSCKRCMSQQTSKLSLLPKRGILEVHGRDSSKLLQGLITNDMELLNEEKHKVIHTYVLNVQGRILYDLFIYRSQQQQDGSAFLLECDIAEIENLAQYLKRYKLRSKVKFVQREELNIYALFGNEVDCTQIDDAYIDPRLPAMGSRIVTDNSDIQSIADNVKTFDNSLNLSSEIDFSKHRYRTGITEGVPEVSNGIPLEYNGAFHQSISFQKGCYVGQELVARAHFTGVIRKRVMPLTFGVNIVENSIENATIYNKKNKRVGKLLGAEGNLGIGLMRLKESMKGDEIHLKMDGVEVEVKPHRPTWWPDSVEY